MFRFWHQAHGVCSRQCVSISIDESIQTAACPYRVCLRIAGSNTSVIATPPVLKRPRLHILHLPRIPQVQSLGGLCRLQHHRLICDRVLRPVRRFQNAGRFRRTERAVRPLPHRLVGVVRHQSGRAQVVGVDRKQAPVPEQAHRDRIAVLRGQPDVFASSGSRSASVVVVTYQPRTAYAATHRATLAIATNCPFLHSRRPSSSYRSVSTHHQSVQPTTLSTSSALCRCLIAEIPNIEYQMPRIDAAPPKIRVAVITFSTRQDQVTGMGQTHEVRSARRRAHLFSSTDQ